MTLADIENLTVAELKANRDKFTEEAKGAPLAELAARYVARCLDAKMRDEKLAEQGLTITALTTGTDALKQQLAERDAALESLRAQHAALGQTLEAERTKRDQDAEANRVAREKADELARQTVTKLKDDLAAETARAARLKRMATTHHAAASASAKLLNDALAAQAIENAEGV